MRLERLRGPRSARIGKGHLPSDRRRALSISPKGTSEAFGLTFAARALDGQVVAAFGRMPQADEVGATRRLLWLSKTSSGKANDPGVGKWDQRVLSRRPKFTRKPLTIWIGAGYMTPKSSWGSSCPWGIPFLISLR